MGVDFAKTKLRVGIFGAEPWTEGMRVEIEKRLHLDALDIYGLSEIIGPGVAIECIEAKSGPAHLRGPLPAGDHQPGHPGKPSPPGQLGELVITTLTKEALPAAALPHPGHHLAELRPLQMRPHHRSA